MSRRMRTHVDEKDEDIETSKAKLKDQRHKICEGIRKHSRERMLICGESLKCFIVTEKQLDQIEKGE